MATNFDSDENKSDVSSEDERGFFQMAESDEGFMCFDHFSVKFTRKRTEMVLILSFKLWKFDTVLISRFMNFICFEWFFL